jgi:hypothetical protein
MYLGIEKLNYASRHSFETGLVPTFAVYWKKLLVFVEDNNIPRRCGSYDCALAIHAIDSRMFITKVNGKCSEFIVALPEYNAIFIAARCYCGSAEEKHCQQNSENFHKRPV